MFVAQDYYFVSYNRRLCTIHLSALRLIGVRVGDHDISKERDCDRDENGLELECAERYQDFGVQSVHYHPQYTRVKLQNDIAIIRLNSSVDFRPLNVKSICLPYGTAANLNHKKVRILALFISFISSDWRD